MERFVSPQRVRRSCTVIVPAGSPLARAHQLLDDLAFHLPGPNRTAPCIACVGLGWPCAPFRHAADHLHRLGLRLELAVPADLHHLLPPPPGHDAPPIPAGAY